MLPTYQSYQLFNLFSIANFVYLSICIWHLAVVFFQVHFDWDFLFLFFQIQKRKLSVLENERKIFSFFDSEGERERERERLYTWDILPGIFLFFLFGVRVFSPYCRLCVCVCVWYWNNIFGLFFFHYFHPSTSSPIVPFK